MVSPSTPQEEGDREALYPNLLEPHRLKNMMVSAGSMSLLEKEKPCSVTLCSDLVVMLQGIKIAFIAAGSAAVHCIAGDMDGRLYTWGRNEVSCCGSCSRLVEVLTRCLRVLCRPSLSPSPAPERPVRARGPCVTEHAQDRGGPQGQGGDWR